MKPEILIRRTADGSDTIYVPVIDDHYHSIYGAVTESQHIFIKAGLDYCKADPVRIFEVGFGTGLNALLTAIKSRDELRAIWYETIEKYPLPESVTSKMNYADFVNGEGFTLYSRIHSCDWNTRVRLTDNFTLIKITGDLTTTALTGSFDLIYFDAFGPDKQPEMWTDEVIKNICEHTLPNGIFVTYSAKGEIKRRLTKYGFRVTCLPGPPGKRQIIRAVKI